MKQPIYFRDRTWRFVVEYADATGIPRFDPKHPGRIAFEAGIISRPDLLRDSVIELDDECEYLIDARAAIQLKEPDSEVILVRLGDDTKKRVATRAVVTAIKGGRVFDQLPLSA